MNEERTVHRLEAFSDIVIGFGLAQLGAVLIINPKTMTLGIPGVIAYFGAFAIICSLWYFHHLLFENFFVPKTWPIVLNFLWLAIVVLLVFCAAHFNSADAFANANLDLLYFGLYSVAYAILAAQTILGMRERRDAAQEQRAKARRNVTFMSYWAAVFACCFLLVKLMPPTAVLGNAISLTFAIAFFGSIGMGVYFRRLRAVDANA